jgi:hypothetical protein
MIKIALKVALRFVGDDDCTHVLDCLLYKDAI